MARILLIAFAAVVGLHLLKKYKRLNKSARRKAWRETLVLVGVVAAVVIFARVGLQWVGVAIAAVWAIFRGLAPYALHLLPFLQRRRASEPEAQQDRAPPGGASSSTATPGAKPKPKQLMSREEALQVLGIEEGASRETILVAYRSLIKKVHPDSPGGSNYLASKLNQAKDVLLS